MKRAAALLLLLSLLSALMGCGAKNEKQSFVVTEMEAVHEELQPEETGEETSETNILVVYFSRTGNTKALAEYAVDCLNADFFEIEAAVPYTDADIAYYTNCRADQEQADPAVRPEIANQIPNIQQYDMIVLGYPIWHGQAPRIISTFLESYDFSGITILPFCTSQSSGIGSSDKELHSLCNAQWQDGKRFAANGDEQAFAEWLSNNMPANAVKDEDDTMSQKMTLMIDGTVIPVIWENNPSVAELTEQAARKAMQIEMSMYGGWEQVGSLGCSIPRKDVQLTAEIGDIMLYSGNQIVLFYGENSWAYTKLGHMDIPDDRVRDLLSAEAVTVTLSAQ